MIDPKSNSVVVTQPKAQKFIENWIKEESLEALKSCFEGNANSKNNEIAL